MDVDRNPDRVHLIADSTVDRLTNPPHRIRGELRPSTPVEALGRANEAKRALLDQVEERHATIRVRASHDDDEAKIRLDQAMHRRQVALLDPLCQPDLLGRRQQAMPADLTQVLRERIRSRSGLIRSLSLLGHAETVGAPQGRTPGDWPAPGVKRTSPFPRQPPAACTFGRTTSNTRRGTRWLTTGSTRSPFASWSHSPGRARTVSGTSGRTRFA